MDLVRILKESLNVKETELCDDSKFSDFAEWDSLTHMFFITKLEETFAIELTGDEIADMQTIGDVKKLLVAKGKKP